MILKILELAWLTIAVISAGLVVYTAIADPGQVIWMILFMFVSLLMYWVRRKQRKVMSKR